MNHRLLFVIEDPFALGANLLLKPMATSLAERGFDIHVVALHAAGRTAGVMTEWPGTIHPCKSPTAASRTVWLYRLVKYINPQTIHAWGARVQMSTLWAAMGHRSARILVSHFELPPRQSVVRGWTSARLSGNNTCLTAMHHSIASRLALDGPEHSIQLMPPAIASGPFDRGFARQRLLGIAAKTDANIGPKAHLIGTVARLEPAWRLKDLVWAIDLLCCVRDDIHLFVFGSGSGGDNLTKFICKTAARQHIHLVPPEWTHQNDLAGLDIFWNAQTESPLQNAMLTAMSLAIPTVSVLAEETVQAVLPLTTALATNRGARDEFARWTKYLIEQPDSARKIADQGRAHVEKLFPAKQAIDSYANLHLPS